MIDAGLLIAIDRDEPDAKEFIEATRLEDEPLRTTAPVVAQVWRDGARQARLARFLPTLDIRPFASDQYQDVGKLLRESGTSDVVDAHLLACAIYLGDRIITADVGDFVQLSAHLGAAAPLAESWR